MPAPSPVSAFGVTYRSIREAAAAFGLPESTLRRRLMQAQWDVEVALVVPVTDNCRLEFVGLDNHSRYKISGAPYLYTDNVNVIDFFRPDLAEAYLASHPSQHYNPYIKEENCP